MNRLLLLDTFNFLHRAYHALPRTFTDSNGEPTNAVYGVSSMLINALTQIKPEYIVAALDSQEPTFRVGDYTGYKAHRKPMEDDLASQIPKVFDILDAFGIKTIQVNGYEADDIIGAMTSRYASGNMNVLIFSNDRDLWQLVSEHVFILLPNTAGKIEWLSKKEVETRLGFDRNLVSDYKGLRGDPSDNIPGVYGVGEVTAKKLINTYGTLEEIFKHAQEIEPASLREKLLNSYEQALMSKKLAQIILDVPFQLDIKDCRYKEINKIKVKEVLEKYRFKSLIKRLGLASDESSKKIQTQLQDKNQLGLF